MVDAFFVVVVMTRPRAMIARSAAAAVARSSRFAHLSAPVGARGIVSAARLILIAAAVTAAVS